MSVTSQPVRALPYPCTDSLTLQQPPCRLKYMGERAFSVTAPRLCNALPLIVRDAPTLASFKKLLIFLKLLILTV